MFISSGTSRQRNLPGPAFALRENWTDASGTTWLGWRPFVRTTTGGIQITESDGNRWPPPLEGTTEDLGSEFYTLKQEVFAGRFPYSQLHFRNNSGTPSNPTWVQKGILEGSLIANCFQVQAPSGSPAIRGKLVYPLKYSFPPDMSSSRASLEAKGTTAVALTAPVNQIAHAASAVAELLQRPPNVPGLALLRSRLVALETLAAAGVEFLNAEFGILPTINDARDLVRGIDEVDKAIDQFERDSGRNVRRRYMFPKEVTETDVLLANTYSPVGCAKKDGTPETVAAAFPADVTNVILGFPAHATRRRRTVERTTWFSGAFTYYLPSGYDSHSMVDRRRLMAKLLGAEPDLNTIWQLAPWSWAVDWFSNASQFVTNLQNYLNFGSILRYGYVMETTTVTDTFYAGAKTGIVLNPDDWRVLNTPPYPAITPVTLRTTVKKRVKANPFGFGISWEGLSPIQLAIAAALGITRAVK